MSTVASGSSVETLERVVSCDDKRCDDTNEMNKSESISNTERLISKELLFCTTIRTGPSAL